MFKNVFDGLENDALKARLTVRCAQGHKVSCTVHDALSGAKRTEDADSEWNEEATRTCPCGEEVTLVFRFYEFQPARYMVDLRVQD